MHCPCFGTCPFSDNCAAREGRSTPTRDSSFDYGRPRSGSRSNSVERNGQRASDGGGANGRQRTPDLGRQEGAGRRPLSARGGEANQRSKEAAQNGIVSKVAGPRARERANSPGAALQDVRDRLTEYASYQHEANEATLGTEVSLGVVLRHPVSLNPRQAHATYGGGFRCDALKLLAVLP